MSTLILSHRDGRFIETITTAAPIGAIRSAMRDGLDIVLVPKRVVGKNGRVLLEEAKRFPWLRLDMAGAFEMAFDEGVEEAMDLLSMGLASQ